MSALNNPDSVDLSSVPESAAAKSVLLFGITGYIGGTVFSALASLPHPPKSITAFLRDSKKGDKLSQLSVPSGTTLTPLIGSFEEHEKITKAASEHDVIIQAANADDLEYMQAILKGMKQRKEKTGHRPLLIHTSGTGVLIDDAKGIYPNDKVGLVS
jgi:hypothetical protein